MTRVESSVYRRRAGSRIAWIAISIMLLVYGFNAREREAAYVAGVDYSSEDGGLYYVKYYELHREGRGLLKLYRTSDDTLLAKREFGHGFNDPIKMLWDRDSLMYDTNNSSIFYDGILRLPPAKIDRLLAWIP